MDPHLLLVEPDAPAAQALASRLRAAGFVVDLAPDGADAVARALAGTYACVVTELDTGAVSGFELCRRLRAEPRTEHLPIVVVAARGDEIDRVVAFEVGADDYVTKPCSPRELVLRIRARLRRPGAAPAAVPATPLRAGGLEVDPLRFRASLDGRALPLTTTELALLAALARRAGSVVTRASLLQEVWELPSGRDSRTLDTHLRRLREKLGAAADRVQTIRGVGYRLVGGTEAEGPHPR
ncbi:MAG: response regulator transcription factor [Myxococcota bacterium]